MTDTMPIRKQRNRHTWRCRECGALGLDYPKPAMALSAATTHECELAPFSWLAVPGAERTAQ